MLRKYGYVAFILFILLTSWEQSKADASLTAGVIPEESIRLRILANSDRLDDQWIKRKVRDEIIEYMDSWVEQPQDLAEARILLQEKLPEIETRIAHTLKTHDFTYDFEVSVGEVSFPTKMYGQQVYPAGDYEALRVMLGNGRGENWWCVLFPPLCFIDVVSGEAVPRAELTDAQADDAEETISSKSEAEIELRFFLWDFLHSLLRKLADIFA